MASIDEAYLDMTGTEKLHGPPLRSAQKLHEQMKQRTGLNCSVGIGSSRLMAKICSDKAKPNGVLYVLPGHEQSFLAPLDVGKIPGVGKVTKSRLNQIGIIHIGDLLRVSESVLQENFGKWGIALTGMVGRRLREQNFSARTLQLKLRYSDFSTITRAHSLPSPTQAFTDTLSTAGKLFRENWENGRAIRLLGVQASNFEDTPVQMDLLEAGNRQKWARALSASDRLRDKYGDSAIFLAKTMGGTFRERVHENPAEKPEKKK